MSNSGPFRILVLALAVGAVSCQDGGDVADDAVFDFAEIAADDPVIDTDPSVRRPFSG